MKLPNPIKTRSFIWTPRCLRLLDQRELPQKVVWRACRTWRQVAEAITAMVVRGAPAIGCVAAYGIVLAARARPFRSMAEMRQALAEAEAGLLKARPTAVNLRWALNRMRAAWESHLLPSREKDGMRDGVGRENHPSPSLSLEGRGMLTELAQTLEREAARIEEEDRRANLAMGQHGAALLPEGCTVLTHCNTGSLATAGVGTAFGILWTAFRDGKLRKVIASETRPYLQGARLTAWELQREKIPFELITDNMAAHLMNTEKIDAVVVGADRIAANGDTANKIGTYSLAVLAAHHGIPFYVAAPLSTLDADTPHGSAIPIEERDGDEVTTIHGRRIAPLNVHVRHPAFDVTPARLIAAIVTEHGVARAPYAASLRALSRPALAVI